MYYLKCPGYHKEYIEETGRRLCERIYDHHDKKDKSHMVKHLLENNHQLFLLKISVYFETILLIGNSSGKYRKRCSLNN